MQHFFTEVAALTRALADRQSLAALARLNAVVASVYQLTAVEFERVLSTFPLVSSEERDAARRAFTDL
jgi:hypothetical protein